MRFKLVSAQVIYALSFPVQLKVASMQRESLLCFIVVGILVLLAPTSAEAQFTTFSGKQENIKCLQPVNGTDYKLCHKYSKHFFIAGIYLSDDGYVLADDDNATEYIALEQTKIRELQTAGTLPNPLPRYSINLTQYLVGYSLWLIIILFIGPSLWVWLRRRRNKGNYCFRCDVPLTSGDFAADKCGICGAAISKIQIQSF